MCCFVFLSLPHYPLATDARPTRSHGGLERLGDRSIRCIVHERDFLQRSLWGKLSVTLHLRS